MVLRNDTWFLQALIGFDEGREEGDSDKGYLDGLGDGEEGLEFVFEARRAFDADWRKLVSRPGSSLAKMVTLACSVSAVVLVTSLTARAQK